MVWSDAARKAAAEARRRHAGSHSGGTPNVYYHGTRAHHIASIKKQGLLGGMQVFDSKKRRLVPSVFVTTDKGYARSAARMDGVPGAVVTLRVPKNKQSSLVKSGDSNFYHYGNIPKSWIKGIKKV